MAKNTVPEAKDALNRFKMEAANEVGVNLKQGYNGDLTSKQAGSVGGQMVKKMIKAYEESLRELLMKKKGGEPIWFITFLFLLCAIFNLLGY